MKSPKAINHDREVFLALCTGRGVAIFNWADRKGAFVKSLGRVAERDIIDFRTPKNLKVACVMPVPQVVVKRWPLGVLCRHHVCPGA